MSGIIGASPSVRSGILGKPPIGSTIQITETVLSGRVQHNSQSFTDIGLNGIITPKFQSSHILFSASFGRCQTTQSNLDYGVAFRVYIVGGNNSGVNNDLNGVPNGNRLASLFVTGGMSYNASHNFGGYTITGLDKSSLTTAQVTYKIQAWNQNSGYPLILNGTSNNSNDANHYQSQTRCRGVLQEIST